MNRPTTPRILVGLTIGAIAGSAALLWMTVSPSPSASVQPRTAVKETPGRSQKLAELTSEMARWKDEMQGDLTALRAQLARVDRNQAATGQQLSQLAEQMQHTGSEEASSGTGTEMAASSPEQKSARAEAHHQAERVLMDDTLRAETLDPAWANTAQLAIQTKFHQAALPGVQLREAECRRTLCRMELAMDPTTVQTTAANLLDLNPWSAPGFLQVDTETGEAVMYLAREEYDLPQAGE